LYYQVLLFHLPTITLAFHHHDVAHQARQGHHATGGFLLRRMSTAAWNGSAPTILSTMKKMSKVVSVGLEYSGTKLVVSPSEISILSMQLRKSKVLPLV
jgi:hypothetical protein